MGNWNQGAKTGEKVQSLKSEIIAILDSSGKVYNTSFYGGIKKNKGSLSARAEDSEDQSRTFGIEYSFTKEDEAPKWLEGLRSRICLRLRRNIPEMLGLFDDKSPRHGRPPRLYFKVNPRAGVPEPSTLEYNVLLSVRDCIRDYVKEIAPKR